jgi:hypothetical protein
MTHVRIERLTTGDREEDTREHRERADLVVRDQPQG